MFLAVVAATASMASGEVLSLAGGKLKLKLPGDFRVIARSADGGTVNLRDEKTGRVLVALSTVKQRGLLTSPAVHKQVLEDVLERLRQEGKAMKAEVLSPAASVTEPGLYCKGVDTIRTEGGTYGRSRAMRLLSDQVITSFVAVNDRDEGTRKRLLADAEARLIRAVEVDREWGQRAGGAGKAKVVVTTVKKAGVQFVVPEGLSAKVDDAAEGVVAVLVDAKNPLRRVTVTVVPVSRPAAQGQQQPAAGEELESAAIEKAIELETGKLALAEPIGEFEAAIDSRFIKRQRRTGGSPESQWASDTRQVRVGEKIVSVAMSAPLEDEERTAQDADSVAESVTGAR
jgi:hypothetical protein